MAEPVLPAERVRWTEDEWRLREEIAKVLERAAISPAYANVVSADHILDAVKRAGWTLVPTVHNDGSDPCPKCGGTGGVHHADY